VRGRDGSGDAGGDKSPPATLPDVDAMSVRRTRPGRAAPLGRPFSRNHSTPRACSLPRATGVDRRSPAPLAGVPVRRLQSRERVLGLPTVRPQPRSGPPFCVAFATRGPRAMVLYRPPLHSVCGYLPTVIVHAPERPFERARQAASRAKDLQGPLLVRHVATARLCITPPDERHTRAHGRAHWTCARAHTLTY